MAPSQFSNNNDTSRMYDSHERLISLSALLQDHDYTPTDYDIAYFKRINEAVRDTLISEDANVSHSYPYAVRIVKATQRIYLVSKHLAWARDIDIMAMYSAALICGIGAPNDWDIELGSTTLEQAEVAQDAHWNTLRDLLDAVKTPALVAGTASYMASFIPFSRELANPTALDVAIIEYPALKIVLDAQRVSEMGAVGVVKAKDGAEWLKLMEERFVKYLGMMKTKAGGQEAGKAWEFMVDLREKLLKEVECEVVLDGEVVRMGVVE